MRPGKRLIQAIFIWLTLAVILSGSRFYSYWKELPLESTALEWLCYGFISLLVLVALLDALNRLYLQNIFANRKLSGSISVGTSNQVEIEIRNQSRLAIDCRVYDHYSNLVDANFEKQRFHIKPQQQAFMHYTINAHTRGDANFSHIQLLIDSPLKLWQWTKNIACNDVCKIYPNFTQISHFNLLAGEQSLSTMGIHLKQMRGQGMEFNQLRDYRKGDSLRQVDWGATSRKQRLISKEYQQERDQQIIFLIDCGKRMRTKSQHLSHFDHTLNSLLLLSYVALKQEDAVGFQTFGFSDTLLNRNDRSILPIKGQQQINRLLNQLYDVQPTLSASDYLKAAQDLVKSSRKRALVVLVSNVRDDDLPELEPALKLLKQHHLVLLANLKEASLLEMEQQEIHNFKQAINQAETQVFLSKRQKLLNYFSAMGIITIDSTPEQLPARLVNQYFDIKKSGRL